MDGHVAGRTIPDTATVAITGDIVAHEFDEEVVVLNLSSGMYYGLDGAGALIWRLLKSRVVVADIHDGVMAEYDVDADRCQRDVNALLAELAEHGLIEIRETR